MNEEINYTLENFREKFKTTLQHYECEEKELKYKKINEEFECFLYFEAKKLYETIIIIRKIKEVQRIIETENINTIKEVLENKIQDIENVLIYSRVYGDNPRPMFNIVEAFYKEALQEVHKEFQQLLQYISNIK